MSFSGGGGRKSMSEINVTPLVDVMLVLLIIFMVTAPMMQQGVQVALPKVNTAPIPSNAEPLVVTLTQNGKAYVGKTELQSKSMGTQIKTMMEVRHEKTVYLRADQAIPYGKVMKFIGQLKQSGIDTISLVTEQDDG